MERALGPLFALDAFHAPGYSWAIRLWTGLTGMSVFAAARIVSVAGGAAVVCCTAVLAGRMANQRAVIPAALLAAANASLLKYSTMVMSDAMAAGLVSGVLVCLAPGGTRRGRQFAIAGCLAGGAYLTRYVYIVLLPVGMMAACLLPRGRRLAPALRFTLGFLVVAAPWLIVVGARTGNPFWNHNHLNVAFNMYRGREGWNAFPGATEFPTLGHVIASDPGLFLRCWVRSIMELPVALARTLSLPVAGMTLAGAVVWLRCYRRGWTIVIACAAYTGLMTMVWVERRFLLPLLPCGIVLAATALATVPAWSSLHIHTGRRSMRIRLPWRLLTLILVVALPALQSYRRGCEMLDREPLEYLGAAQWLRQHSRPGTTRILAAKPHIAFLSGATHVDFREQGLQDAGITELKDVVRRSRTDFVVMDSRYAAEEFPRLAGLLAPDRAPPFLRLCRTVGQTETVVIYAVQPYGYGSGVE